MMVNADNPLCPLHQYCGPAEPRCVCTVLHNQKVWLNRIIRHGNDFIRPGQKFKFIRNRLQADLCFYLGMICFQIIIGRQAGAGTVPVRPDMPGNGYTAYSRKLFFQAIHAALFPARRPRRPFCVLLFPGLPGQSYGTCARRILSTGR